MDGVTDYPMRQIQISVARPDVMYTEFVSVEGFARNPKAFEKKLFFKNNERPIVVQFFGHTPKLFYEAISQIVKMGFDGIDINMGCPAKSVIQKGGGGVLIGNYFLAGRIIEESFSAINETKINIPLSVKTRIGRNEIIIGEWIKFLSGFPFSEITVHGRLLKQGNSGPVNWEEIKKAGQILKSKNIVCLGNGGIRNEKEGRELSEKYGLDGILIGEAACGNPWVFSGQNPTREMILKIIIDHARIINEFYDEKGFVTILKHFGWYPKGFKNSKQLKRELLVIKNFEEVLKVVEKFQS